MEVRSTEGTRRKEKRKRKKLKKPLQTAKRRDEHIGRERERRICWYYTSRGNSHKVNAAVLERQSCSVWNSKEVKKDDFLCWWFSPPFALLNQLQRWKSLGKSSAGHSTLFQMKKTCGWKTSETQERFSSNTPLMDAQPWRTMQDDLQQEPAFCRTAGSSHLLPFDIGVSNFNLRSSCFAPTAAMLRLLPCASCSRGLINWSLTAGAQEVDY